MSLFESASLVVTPNGTKASKLYAIKPTSGAGDLSVVRATTATRVNSAGLIESVAVNVPRLDYTNSTCPSILVEPQRTNVIKYSEDFSNVNWLTINFNVSANTTTAPDGTSTADKLIATTTNSAHAFYQAVPTGTYTFSIYAKAAEETLFSMWLNDFSKRAIFDLSTGTITSSNVTNSTITNVGNGWYRCTIYDTTLTSFAAIYGRSGNGYAGNGTDGMFFWGAQSEAASYATSYIPTVASAVTRNADVISKTGISSLIGTEFTLFLDAYETTGGNSTRYLILKGAGGTYANALFLEANASNQIAVTILNSSSSTVFGSITTGLTNGQRFKLAIRCKNNDFAFYVNGVQIATQTSVTVPTTSDLYLGYYTDYDDNYNKINSSVIWKTALTNAELAELTTL